MQSLPESPRYPIQWLRECRATILLAIPIVIGQVVQMLMGIIDTVMIGRLGVVPLGAAAFANTLVQVPFVFGIGLLTAISVLVSQARGADDTTSARTALWHGTFLSLIFGTAVVAIFIALTPYLHLFRQPDSVTEATPAYLILFTISIVPGLIALAWKNHADALNHPWPPFFIFLSGVVLNVILNWMWIYGNAGFPAWGLEGAGAATIVARVATAAGIIFWMYRNSALKRWIPRRLWRPVAKNHMGKLLAIGIPASLAILTEVSAFTGSGLLIGWLGEIPLAAHQIAITCTATAFMIPLGLGMALTVRIGEAAGKGEYHRLRPIAIGGWILGIIGSTLTMLVFLLAGNTISAFFINDSAVIILAANLLIIAGLFQLVDGNQAISVGCLRGIGDVRIPAFIAFIAYWIIAIPLGYILAFPLELGATGVWTGLAAGLTFAAAILAIRLWKQAHPNRFYSP